MTTIIFGVIDKNGSPFEVASSHDFSRTLRVLADSGYVVNYWFEATDNKPSNIRLKMGFSE